MKSTGSNDKNSDQSNQAKVFVIGLDGGTLDLVKPWVEDGKLPYLGELMHTGTYGELTTTIQPLTGPAWTSFMTGKNPGKHGIFDFIRRVPGTYDVRLADSSTRGARSIWNILSTHQKKVAVINIPNNFPPEKVNGVLISWMDAPGVGRDFTHPPELYKEIKENVGEYIITVNFSASLDNHIRDLHCMIDNRGAVTEYIMENHPWDFFIVLFSATDLVQHAFWKYMDSTHPRYNINDAKKYGNTILEVYQKIDERIGRLLKNLDQNTTVIIMSDHGAGPLRKVVNLNRWLEKNDWLSFTAAAKNFSAGSSMLSPRRAFLKTTQSLYRLIKKAPPKVKGRLKKLFPKLGSKVESIFLSSMIDWSHTKAFALGAYGNIWINVRGREPMGTVESGAEFEEIRNQISERLVALKDPDTGEPVVEKVHKREELYHGPFIDRAPDLIVQWKDYAYYSRQRFGEREETVFQTHLTRPLSSIEMNGYHKLNGMLIINGKGINAGKIIHGASILDIAPTILNILGVPVPDDMDGRVLTEIYRPSFKGFRPVFHETLQAETPSIPVSDDYSEKDADIVKERLKNLGYL